MANPHKIDWESEYEEWRKSGQTQVAYCEDKGLNIKAFKNGIYRNRHRSNKGKNMESAPSGRFVPVGITKVGPVNDQKEANSAPYCEIRLGSGSKIIIDKPDVAVELSIVIRSIKNA